MTKALRLSCLSALSLVVLAAGCNSAHMLQSAVNLTGNWSFTSPATANQAALTMNAGLTSQANGDVIAVGHLTGASCISSGTAIQFAGSVADNGKLTLKSAAVNGSTITLSGLVGADGKSLSGTSLQFNGGNCSSLGVVAANTTQYTPINGNYSGTFTDYANHQATVNATLTQTTQPDANGTFHLSGSATFPNNPCFGQPLITDSLVTGSNLSTTYQENGSTIQAVGTFNADATQLTVTSWTVTGGLCDKDFGTGLLIKQ